MTRFIIYNEGSVLAGGPPQGEYFDVTDYEATGDGETDDRLAILAAITAAEGAPVYFPAGTYYCAATLTVPASSDLRGPYLLGPSACTAWIKGRLDYASTSTFSDLKIGDASKVAAQNGANASTTSFTRCHFRGGGGSYYTYVLSLGTGNSCDHISFYDCEVERNLGTETGLSPGYNNICIWCGDSPAVIVTDILFDGCHVGVSNGVATGCPRMNIEAFTEGVTDGSEHGWQEVTLTGCTFESAVRHNIDFSDYCETNQRSTGATITGCLIKGSEEACNVCVEMPLEFEMTGCTVYRGGGTDGASLYITAGHNNNDTPKYVPAGECVVTGNTFDLDYDNGITPGSRPFRIEGVNTVFTGNDITDSQDTTWSLMYLDGANTSTTGNTVSSNTVTQSANRQPVSPSTSISSEINGATGNTLTGNDITRV